MGFFSKLFKGKQSESPKVKAAQAIGGFESAANWSRDRSFIQAAPLEETINPHASTRRELLNLTRYVVSNFSLMERILTATEIYAIGDGLTATAATLDSDFNDRATKAFDQWASSVFASNNNNLSFYEMQKLISRDLLIAGEVFIVLTKAPSGYPQLMLVSSENVKHSGQDSDTSIDGLYVDSFGKVYAYNIFVGKTFQKVDSANVIHLMRHKMVGQRRGVSAFAASLNSLRDHKDLIALEKKAVKVHSSLAAVVTKKSGQADDGLYGNIDGHPNSSNPAKPNAGLERAFPAAVIYGEEGETYTLLSSDRSTDGFKGFLELLARDVCQNISLPYEFLVNAEKLTGVGIRFVLNDADFFFKGLQTIIIDGALGRIYSWVIASLIKSGALEGPKESVMPWDVSWTRPISITIDSQRVTNAEISLLQNSLTTLDAYWSARGKNWKDQVTQRAKEEKFLDDVSKEFGIDVNRLRALAAGGPSISQPEDEETETEEFSPEEHNSEEAA